MKLDQSLVVLAPNLIHADLAHSNITHEQFLQQLSVGAPQLKHLSCAWHTKSPFPQSQFPRLEELLITGVAVDAHGIHKVCSACPELLRLQVMDFAYRQAGGLPAKTEQKEQMTSPGLPFSEDRPAQSMAERARLFAQRPQAPERFPRPSLSAMPPPSVPSGSPFSSFSPSPNPYAALSSAPQTPQQGTVSQAPTITDAGALLRRQIASFGEFGTSTSPSAQQPPFASSPPVLNSTAQPAFSFSFGSQSPVPTPAFGSVSANPFAAPTQSPSPSQTQQDPANWLSLPSEFNDVVYYAALYELLPVEPAVTTAATTAAPLFVPHPSNTIPTPSPVLSRSQRRKQKQRGSASPAFASSNTASAPASQLSVKLQVVELKGVVTAAALQVIMKDNPALKTLLVASNDLDDLPVLCSPSLRTLRLSGSTVAGMLRICVCSPAHNCLFLMCFRRKNSKRFSLIRPMSHSKLLIIFIWNVPTFNIWISMIAKSSKPHHFSCRCCEP